ncbi:YraN family protein [Defluviimonas salinarum]|uniref:UPF0102 protein OM960_13850 n=1 Tax=Defluviimonas salinarum TaxID=2992147 RepID=A0ABT3J4Q8_9RHOB|nr:YraN family protein [Defluviimonas salinarum]MCW3782668.1 YraN family protein [Defluviimonas salinarum]
MTGAVAHHGGRAAEDQVEALYTGAGYQIAARRWRGRGGEIDLIARDGNVVVFIEVKRAATHACAAERLSARQAERIYRTASEFLEGEPAGQDSEVRFDVALVDGQGRIELVRNAIGV